MIAAYQNNIDVELQQVLFYFGQLTLQRSCEYTKLFNYSEVRTKVLERIPVVEARPEQTAKPVHGNSFIKS